jgi:hypothetical protein
VLYRLGTVTLCLDYMGPCISLLVADLAPPMMH